MLNPVACLPDRAHFLAALGDDADQAGPFAVGKDLDEDVVDGDVVDLHHLVIGVAGFALAEDGAPSLR